MNTTLFSILTLLFIKHYVADFLYQPKWMWSNKHKLYHYGSICHSGFHVVLTALILLVYSMFSIKLIVLEYLIHSITDALKMKIGIKYVITPNEPIFWNLLGIDQLIHSLTYVFILASVISS